MESEFEESMAIFTLDDEKIIWTDKSSQMNKSSDVQTERTNFSTNKSSEKTIFPIQFDHQDEQVDGNTT